MIPPDQPIHPATKALFAIVLFAVVVVWAASAAGPTVTLGALALLVVALVLYDVMTLGRDVRRERAER